MKIESYRTLRWADIHLSFEAKVVDGDNTYYINFDVNDKGLPEQLYEDGCWAYDVPLDKISRWDDSDKHVIYDVDFTEMFEQMLKIWNANPVFDESAEWKTL